MYGSGARVTRLFHLNQGTKSEKVSRPPTIPVPATVSLDDLFGSAKLARGAFGQGQLPSVFEVVKLPIFGLNGGGSSRPGMSIVEMLRAASIPSIGNDNGLLKTDPHPRQMLERIGADGLAELIAPPRPFSPAEDVSHLTLAPCKDKILKALSKEPAIVISAPTSSGKTTWLPRTLLKHVDALFQDSYLAPAIEPHVYCAVPRVIQTIKIGQYVSSLLGDELGETCGYLNSQTGRVTPGVTKLTYLTHGYLEQLMLHRQIPDGSILIFDEAHENPAALSTVLLLAREMIDKGRAIKLVLTSATINARNFSAYLDRAPIIDPTESSFNPAPNATQISYEQEIVEDANRGRHKKIRLLPSQRLLEHDIIDAVDRGDTPIVFVPGKNEIEEVIDAVGRLDPSIRFIPFHAKLPLRDQQRVFEPSPDERTVIIATNVGGTGLTYPPHVNTVIITDEVKSLIQLDGFDTLAYRQITRTEVLQLLGRIGRLDRDGNAVLRLSGAASRKVQPLYEDIPPEIQNMGLATMMLRYRAAGRSLQRDNENFIHKASEEQLVRAERTLFRLGLFGPTGFITEIGRAAARYPVDAPLGKLLAQAEELRSTHPRVLLAAIDIAAIIEAEGIVPKNLRDWQGLRSTNSNSDVIAQFEVLQKAATMRQEELEEFGLPEAQLYRALDMRRALRARCSLMDAPEDVCLSPVEVKIFNGLYSSAFLPWLYRRVDGGRGGEALYKWVAGVGKRGDDDGADKPDVRLLSKGSVVNNAQYIVAYPFNIELSGVSSRVQSLLERINGYENTLPLLLHAHAIDPEWLKKNIPPQFREAREAVKKDSRQPRGRSDDRPPTRTRPRR